MMERKKIDRLRQRCAMRVADGYGSYNLTINTVLELLESAENERALRGEVEGLNKENEMLEGADLAMAAMESEFERLRTAHENMTHIIQNASCSRCDYCILETEPCMARGLHAECCFEYCSPQQPTQK